MNTINLFYKKIRFLSISIKFSIGSSALPRPCFVKRISTLYFGSKLLHFFWSHASSDYILGKAN